MKIFALARPELNQLSKCRGIIATQLPSYKLDNIALVLSIAYYGPSTHLFSRGGQ